MTSYITTVICPVCGRVQETTMYDKSDDAVCISCNMTFHNNIWRKLPDNPTDNELDDIKIDLFTRDVKRKNRMSLMKNPTTGKFLELFGPTVEYLTSPQYTQNEFCVLKGTIPIPQPTLTKAQFIALLSAKMGG